MKARRQSVTMYVCLCLFGIGYCWGQNEPNELFQRAYQLEANGDAAGALVLYRQLITQYPSDSLSGPDKADFSVKHLECLLALRSGDTAAAREIAEKIRKLNSSPQQKPVQLCSVGIILHDAELYEDAQSFFQQLISDYPEHRVSGPDNGGFLVKFIHFEQAIKRGDIAAAINFAEQIRMLNSSAEHKPDQLYWIGNEFESVGAASLGYKSGKSEECFEAALSFYRMIAENYPGFNSYGYGNDINEVRAHIDAITFPVTRVLAV